MEFFLCSIYRMLVTAERLLTYIDTEILRVIDYDDYVCVHILLRLYVTPYAYHYYMRNSDFD